jgi:Skp family chaperone for outer membrane proteins
MKNSPSRFSGLVAVAIFVSALYYPISAQSKTWTVDERQAKLMQDVNAAQKAGKLTAKQANQLRKSLAEIARKKKKLQDKAGGSLNAEDTSKLQSAIDRVSSKIKTEIDESHPVGK